MFAAAKDEACTVRSCFVTGCTIVPLKGKITTMNNFQNLTFAPLVSGQGNRPPPPPLIFARAQLLTYFPLRLARRTVAARRTITTRQTHPTRCASTSTRCSVS